MVDSSETVTKNIMSALPAF